MATPNLLSISAVLGRTRADLCTTSITTILQNLTASNELLRINAIYVTNISLNDEKVNLAFYRSSLTYYIVLNNPIPVGTTTILMDKNNGIYLEEGDALRIAASANNAIQYLISYEVIS